MINQKMKKEKRKLRERLGSNYISYTQLKERLEKGTLEAWYGIWHYQMKQSEDEDRSRRLAFYKSEMDQIMKKLGHEKWTDKDVMAELNKLQNSEE